MLTYAARRVLGLFPILATAVVLTFIANQFVPGDPIMILLSDQSGDPVLEARLRAEPPYHALFGVRAESFDPKSGEVILRLPFRRELQRSSTAPQIHGSVIATLVNMAGEYAMWVKLGYSVPTINIHVDYLAMGVATDLLATGRVIKAGRSIGVADAEIRNTDNALLAVGRGTYATRPPK